MARQITRATSHDISWCWFVWHRHICPERDLRNGSKDDDDDEDANDNYDDEDDDYVGNGDDALVRLLLPSLMELSKHHRHRRWDGMGLSPERKMRPT